MQDHHPHDPPTYLGPLTRRGFLGTGLALAATAITAPADAIQATPALTRPMPLAPRTTPPDDLHFAPLVEAARAIRERTVSCEELTRHLLDRIERHEPALNAYTTLLADQALAQARTLDAAAARDQWFGPLHGVPVSIKDSIAIRGVVSTAGDPDLANFVQQEDAPVVARLRAAGAVFLGHTNMPMNGDDFQSYNDLFGRTSNPWDLSRTPGGSTGGGGAAVSAGLSFLSTGSDFGGSIRVPSHFCGIFGHRGTRNVIPTEGHGPPRPGVPPRPKSEESVVGPLARSAADLKLALQVCGGPVGPMSAAYRWELPQARGNVLEDYRIGYVVDDPFCRVSSDVRQAYERAVDELRAAGARLEEGWPVDDLETTYHAWYYLIAALLNPELEGPALAQARALARNQDGSRAAIWNLAAISPYARYLQANGERLRIQAAWQEWFRTHDAFLMPTTFVAAFPHDTESYALRWSRILQTPEGPRDYLDLHVWTSLSGLTGHPVTVAPAGRTGAGLPVGFQVLGPYMEDATSIDVAANVGEVLGGYTPPPGY
jgi:amidase